MKTQDNSVGTISFEHQFPGMRKPQEFIVYPLAAVERGKDDVEITVQSDTRFGKIHMTTGRVHMAGPISGGAYGHHLALAKDLGTLSGADLTILKSAVFASASGRAGTRGVIVDNSGAVEVFGTAADESMTT